MLVLAAKSGAGEYIKEMDGKRAAPEKSGFFFL